MLDLTIESAPRALLGAPGFSDASRAFSGVRIVLASFGAPFTLIGEARAAAHLHVGNLGVGTSRASILCELR